MTKEEYLKQMEGPCVEAAYQAIFDENGEGPDSEIRALAVDAYRAVGLKLMEGLEAIEDKPIDVEVALPTLDGGERMVEAIGFPLGEVLFRLTLPKEQSE